MIKKVLIPMLILVILGGLAWWLSNQDSQSTINREDTDFAVTDTAAIDKIVLRDRNNNKIKLTRKNQNQWLINDKYKASQTKIQTLLTTIKEVEVKNPVPVNARENVIKNMASNNVKAEIYQDGKLVQAYFVGHQTNDEKGTYMAIDNENKQPYVTHIPGFVGYLTPRYFTDVKEWRTTEVFSYNPVSITSVKVEYPQNVTGSFQLTVFGNDDFSIEEIDGRRVLDNPEPRSVKKYLLGFEDVHFVRTLDKTNKKVRDSLANETPGVIISVESDEQPGKTVKLYPISDQNQEKSQFGPEKIVNPSRFCAISSDRPEDVMIIQKQALKKILKSFSDFKSEKNLSFVALLSF